VHRAWRSAFPAARIPRGLSTPVTTLFTVLCWVPFRQTSWDGTLSMFSTLFGLGAGRAVWLPAVLGWSLLIVVAGHAAGVLLLRNQPQFLSAIDAERRDSPISGPQLVFGWHSVRGAFTVFAMILLIYFFGAVTTSPFIYFRF